MLLNEQVTIRLQGQTEWFNGALRHHGEDIYALDRPEYESHGRTRPASRTYFDYEDVVFVTVEK